MSKLAPGRPIYPPNSRGSSPAPNLPFLFSCHDCSSTKHTDQFNWVRTQEARCPPPERSPLLRPVGIGAPT